MYIIITLIIIVGLGFLYSKGQKQIVDHDSKLAEERAYREYCREIGREYTPLYKEDYPNS